MPDRLPVILAALDAGGVPVTADARWLLAEIEALRERVAVLRAEVTDLEDIVRGAGGAGAVVSDRVRARAAVRMHPTTSWGPGGAAGPPSSCCVRARPTRSSMPLVMSSTVRRGAWRMIAAPISRCRSRRLRRPGHTPTMRYTQPSITSRFVTVMPVPPHRPQRARAMP